MSRLEEIEERRAERKAALAGARDEQYALDLEALDAIEVERGDGAVAALNMDRFTPGSPTMVVLRTPSGAEYKRFCDQVGRAVEKGDSAKRRDAQDMLAKSVWLYPVGKEAQDALLAVYPGLLVSIALRATQLVEAKAQDEGKG